MSTLKMLLNMMEVLVMDNSEMAERFKSRSSEVPLWHRQNLSVQETCAYTGLGRETILSNKAERL